MRKRWVVGGVLVTLLAVSATSLAVHQPWLEGRWDAARAASGLASDLEHLDGVHAATAVYDPLGLPDPTVEVDVAFDRTAPSRSWGTASSMVRSAAASRRLAGTTTTASFRQRGSTATADVEPLAVSPATLTGEIAAWRTLRRAVGDRISLHLGRASAYTDGTGPMTREYRVRSASDMRAIAAVWPAQTPSTDPTLPTAWVAPGLQLSRMPDARVMHAVSALADVVRLAPADGPRPSDTGTYGVVLGNVRGFQVEVLALDHGKPATAQPDRRLVDATRVALASGAAQVDWSTSAGIPSIVAGACGTSRVGGRTITTTFSTTPENDRFAAALVAQGLRLPPGVRGGVCS